GSWLEIYSGTSDASGTILWKIPFRDFGTGSYVQRITVTKGDDQLVLDPSKAPDSYADNQWFPTRETWLQWTQGPTNHRDPEAQTLVHLFTERPVYRPEEEVHLKGYLRSRLKGKLDITNVKKASLI